MQSPNGNIRIGSGSTGWAHVLTDRPKFYFQKEIRVNSGNIGSYDENLSLKTAGSTKMTILNSNGFVGIGILSPQARLHIASGTDVNLSGGGHLVLGSTAITNLALDNNEIQARNNGSASNLFLQLEGGSIGVGTASLPFKFNVAGDVYANGGWVRVGGNAGIYFQNHGGGFRMIDNTWIRTFGGKSFYHDTGIMRTDGIFQVGPEGNRFLVAANGNIGVGTTTPTKKLDVNGNFGAHEVFVNGGWVRVSGNTGIYFQNHGGGFRMQDSSWIRTFGGKSFYHDTGIMRTDGIFQVGPTGRRFLVAANGNGGYRYNHS